MASCYNTKSCQVSFAVVVMFLFVGEASAQLSTNFYASSCPQVFNVVKPIVQSAIIKQKRMGASLLRLFFHDCFVGGCDASLLLDDTKTFTGEKTAVPNNGSIRGLGIVDRIKAQVEKVCPGVVSCADILAIAARDSVVLLGGPSWTVKLGRRDSRTANKTAADNMIPPPSSSLANLTAAYAVKGLSIKDLVVLTGAHTIGKSRCTNYRSHIYNDTDIDPSFAKSLQPSCPRQSGNGDNNLHGLDSTENVFDNDYFKNLINKKGLLHSDQELFSGGATDSFVRIYASNKQKFFADFVTSMSKMGDITPLTGSQGEIRKMCRKLN